MKKIILPFLVLLISSGLVFSQGKKNKSILLLKQSPEIDSLLNNALNQCSKSHPYYSLEALGRNNTYFFYFSVIVDKEDTLYFSKDRKNLGFFNYGGSTIFVHGDRRLYAFFKKTNKGKDFSFFDPTSAAHINIDGMTFYKYAKDKFIAHSVSGSF
ncbi:MAG TPA: hypothetical protein VK668_07320 [Mucilaginibacter sp.]|nr:hypothetical protein [Mucilaginibacter sp.]